jgi:hypothetical protein
MMASKCSSKLAPSRPESLFLTLHGYGLQVHLQTCLITASKCISKLTWSGPRRVFLTSHDYGRQTASITTLEFISKFTRSQGGGMMDLACYRKGIHEKERFKLAQCRMRLRLYEGIAGHDVPNKLRRSSKPWQECMKPSAGKD